MYITIGRNPQSDIVITGYDVVSYDHATIEYENGNYLFIDDSSNGTYIGDERINHESRPVKPGDPVMLAGRCPLDWNLVLNKVKAMGGNIGSPVPETSRPTMPHVQQQPVTPPQPSNPPQPSYTPPQNNQPQYMQSHNTGDKYMQSHNTGDMGSSSTGDAVRRRFHEREINQWNWGAFLLSWIWGIFNNVYWTLIALIPIPLVGLVVSIIAGVKGTRQSWENGKWQDADIEAFQKKQKGWMIAGFIVLGVAILLPIIMWSTIINALAAIM